MYKTILACLLVFVLAGCATLKYEEPTSGPRARVRFAVLNPSLTVLYRYDDEKCNGEAEWMRLRAGTLLTGNPKRLGMPLWEYHENAAKEVYVTSGKRFYGMMTTEYQSGMYKHRCGVPFAFDLEDGKDYEVVFKTGASCSATVSRLEDRGGQPTRVAIPPVTRFSEACRNAALRTRLY